MDTKSATSLCWHLVARATSACLGRVDHWGIIASCILCSMTHSCGGREPRTTDWFVSHTAVYFSPTMPTSLSKMQATILKVKTEQSSFHHTHTNVIRRHYTLRRYGRGAVGYLSDLVNDYVPHFSATYRCPCFVVGYMVLTTQRNCVAAGWEGMECRFVMHGDSSHYYGLASSYQSSRHLCPRQCSASRTL